MKEIDITFHYTNEEMVKELLEITPYRGKILDPCSGLNKVFYNNFNTDNKDWCEIDLGRNFYDYKNEVDWCISNPPYHILWKDENYKNGFMGKTMEICNKGFGYLVNLNGFNSFTPKRLQLLKEEGFYLQKLHIVSDSRWFGRYYYMIFSKEKLNSFLTWNEKTYKK